MNISKHKGWTELERRLGITGLEAFINQEVIPPLDRLERAPETKDGFPESLTWPIMIGLVAFMICFMFIESQMPRNALGMIGSFVLFPTLFIGFMALAFYFMRHEISEIIVKAENNFLMRSQVLGRIAARLDMDYVPTPGGASRVLLMIAKWKFCPQKIKDVVALMESKGGLKVQSEAIRRSGLVMPLELVLGSKETKAKSYDLAQENLQFQDGFSGARNGIDFAVMEWEESHDDFSYHHLLIHLTLPYKLTSWVEFKNKASRWPQSRPNVSLKKVAIPYSPFNRAYDIRASDQTEARMVFNPRVIEALSLFAANDPARGVAFENNLVFDVRGDNRFELVNIATGQWSEDSIERTFTDIVQMLELVDATANSFAIKVRQTA